MDVVFCLLPIVFLIYATIKRNPLPTTLSLPLAAVMMFFIRLAYLGSDPLLTTAAVILGLHEALTPLTIMVRVCVFQKVSGFLFVIACYFISFHSSHSIHLY